MRMAMECDCIHVLLRATPMVKYTVCRRTLPMPILTFTIKCAIDIATECPFSKEIGNLI